MVEPSEVSENVANALSNLFPKDFIFFTMTGTVVASAAARDISPCALQLGGASPFVIADDASGADLAAKRIFWG